VNIINDEELHYHAHVLRFWREHNRPDAWRFSLEDVRTGERRGFADLDALMAFLRAAITHNSTVRVNAEKEDA
jgi:hypothetical protein